MLRLISPPVVILLLLSGCRGPKAALEEGEWLPGGETTNTLLLGGNAFLRPAANLTPENEQDFYSGNSFFNQGWVEAPASTEKRDGLGPLFNARTCSGCHFRDGKAEPPEDGKAPFVGLLLRLSIPGEDGPEPDPVYGAQLQDQAIDDVPVEALPEILTTEIQGSYADGTSFSLLAPEYILHEPGYGDFHDELMVSPRIAPHMIGLGLLEAIEDSRLMDLADPDDADGDGISGRLQLHGDAQAIGRFGWKGEAVDVEEQSAGAFSGDMGLTSRLFEADDCTDAQTECHASMSGGEPEVEDHILDLVVLYSRAISVPVRRAADDPDVLRGKYVFGELGCGSCHVPSHTTGSAALPELEGQLIWPYTDLLLHDMGDGLADDRPVGEASGREWKTPPLWGLGLVDDVGGHTRFLHDGRARSLEEAILWHGGEAQASRDAFVALDARERTYLLGFLEDL